MKFLRTEYQNQIIFYETDFEKMRLYNYRGGWHDIDENSMEWLIGEIIEAEGWYELYLKYNFNPLSSTMVSREGWLSPEGEFWDGEGHLCLAEDICDIKYGIQ